MTQPEEPTVPTDESGTPPASVIDETLVRILVCPLDRGELRVVAAELVCTVCGRRWHVEWSRSVT